MPLFLRALSFFGLPIGLGRGLETLVDGLDDLIDDPGDERENNENSQTANTIPVCIHLRISRTVILPIFGAWSILLAVVPAKPCRASNDPFSADRPHTGGLLPRKGCRV